jgi:hypothetical protein
MKKHIAQVVANDMLTELVAEGVRSIPDRKLEDMARKFGPLSRENHEILVERLKAARDTGRIEISCWYGEELPPGEQALEF